MATAIGSVVCLKGSEGREQRDLIDERKKGKGLLVFSTSGFDAGPKEQVSRERSLSCGEYRLAATWDRYGHR